MAGRPRKLDVPRKPCGHVQPAPKTAPDLLEKRKALVGEAHHADPRASYPLGILAIRGLLSSIDHSAGLRFAALHHIVWGRRGQGVKSHLAQLVAGIVRHLEADDPNYERRVLEAADEIGTATAVVLGLGTRRPFQVLENIAVYERELRFMDLTRPRSPEAWRADQRDIAALQEATDALARHWKMGEYGNGGADVARV